MLTWSRWIPEALYVRDFIDWQPPELLGLVAGYSPAIAAIVLTSLIHGRAGLARIVARLFRWRVPFRWYAVVLLLPLTQALAAFGLYLLFGGELTRAGAGTTERDLHSIVLETLPLAVMFILGFDGLGEELGWRGFALPRLLSRRSPLIASMILGTMWALWHLPYALTPGTAMASRPYYSQVPEMLAASVVFTWVFQNTRGSILLAILLHAAGNVTVNILPSILPGIYHCGICTEVVRWALVCTIAGGWLKARLNQQSVRSREN